MSKWLIFFMLTLCGCTDLITGEGDLNPVLDKINTMSLDIVTLQIDVLQLERDILTELGLARKYLTNDLMSNLVPNYIHKQVQSAVADIFKSRSVKDIVSDHLGKKITYLTGNVHQLKRRFELTTDEFEDRSRDWRTHIESLDKRMKKLNSKVSALDNLGNMNVRHEEFFEKIFQLKSEMWSNMSRIQKDVYDKIQFQAEVSSNMTKKQDLLYRNIQHINEEVSINRQTLAAMSEVNKQLKQQNQQLLAKVHSHNESPQQVSYQVRLVRDSSFSQDAVLKFDDVTVNKGNAFDSQSGVFTAPVSGTYLFWANVMRNNNKWMAVRIKHNGILILNGYTTAGQHPHGVASITGAVYLKKRDTITVCAMANDARVYLRGDMHSSYGGTLLNAK